MELSVFTDGANLKNLTCKNCIRLYDITVTDMRHWAQGSHRPPKLAHRKCHVCRKYLTFRTVPHLWSVVLKTGIILYKVDKPEWVRDICYILNIPYRQQYNPFGIPCSSKYKSLAPITSSLWTKKMLQKSRCQSCKESFKTVTDLFRVYPYLDDKTFQCRQCKKLCLITKIPGTHDCYFQLTKDLMKFRFWHLLLNRTFHAWYWEEKIQPYHFQISHYCQEDNFWTHVPPIPSTDDEGIIV